VQSATVKLAAASPLKLQGFRFASGETVTVSVRLGAKRSVVRAHADAAGGFVLRFPKLSVVRCGPALAVTAVGSHGSRAAFSLNKIACGTGAISRSNS
jgi:succinate-acetate transporter protein